MKALNLISVAAKLAITTNDLETVKKQMVDLLVPKMERVKRPTGTPLPSSTVDTDMNDEWRQRHIDEFEREARSEKKPVKMIQTTLNFNENTQQ